MKRKKTKPTREALPPPNYVGASEAIVAAIFESKIWPTNVSVSPEEQRRIVEDFENLHANVYAGISAGAEAVKRLHRTTMFLPIASHPECKTANEFIKKGFPFHYMSATAEVESRFIAILDSMVEFCDFCRTLIHETYEQMPLE